VRENTSLPIFVTMTFDKSRRTFLGVSPESFARTAAGLGVAALGLNCSLTPSAMTETVEMLVRNTPLPIIVKPNAGLPEADGGYNITPSEFARQMEVYASLGARIVGGCCGSNPEFIAELKDAYSRLKPSRPPVNPGTYLATATNVFDVTGMKNAAANLTAHTTADAIADESAAHSDDDVAIPVLLPQNLSCGTAFDAVTEIQSRFDRPLHIICSDADALEEALRAVVGIPAVTCGGSPELRKIAARYGAVPTEDM
jgi:5-methyltetrahydrofolate--homocysteine methyltransferase